MKRLFIAILVSVFLISCTSLPPLYKVSSEKRDSRFGAIEISSLILHLDGKTLTGWNEILNLVAYKRNRITKYYIRLDYYFSDGRFIKSIKITTDTGLYTLKNSDISREISSLVDDIQDRETLMLELSNGIISDLTTTSKLTIQYALSPINVSSRGVAALHEFLH